MTNGPKPSIHAASFSLADLLLSVQNDEALGLSLKSIDIVYVTDKADANKELWTTTHYDWGTVDYDTLQIEADTSSGKPPPDGMKLVCRGRAMVLGTQTPVVAFRKA